jgi:acylphosphatase
MPKPMIETDMVHRRHCLFSGRVQGVGFRYTTKNIAMRHNVTGYVRNLPDGRVELVMEGPPQEIQGVLESVSQRMNDYIQGVDQSEFPATGEFAHFSIRGC